MRFAAPWAGRDGFARAVAGARAKMIPQEAITVDSLGDVIAVGEQAVSLDGLRSRMVIRKYHAETGAVLWEREVPTKKETQTPAGMNVARGVAVDAFDNIYVVGEVRPDGKNRQLWLGKYTHDGLQAATHVSDEPMSRGNGVAVDGDGQVYVAGHRYDTLYENVATLDAFNAALAPLWSDAIVHAGTFDTRAYDVAIDRHGDVVVAGSTWIGKTDWKGLVALYTPAGERPWLRIPAATGPDSMDRLFSVVVTDANEYVLAGRREAGEDPRRLWLVRMNESGDELASEADYVNRCGDPIFSNDTDVCGIAQGPLGRLVMAGVGHSDTDDFQIKQTRSDWAIHLWVAVADGYDQALDRGLGVAVDEDGYVTAAGYETHLGAPRWWVTRRHP